ncbi:MAG: TolC family protein, partial [Deltaproteobacteria bacterium]
MRVIGYSLVPRRLAGPLGGLAALLCGTPVLAQPAPAQAPAAITPARPEPLSLSAAVDRALAHDAGIRQADLEIRAARARVDGVRGHYGPSLDVDGKLLLWNDESTLTVVDPSSVDLSAIPAPFDAALAGLLSSVGEPISLRDQVTGEVSVTVVQPLTDLYRVDRGVRLAEAGVGAADARAELARRDLTFAVTETYLGLVAARELTAVAAEAERVLAAHVSDAEKLSRVGLVSDAQVLAARAELARTRSQLVKARAGAELLAARLARLVAPEGEGVPASLSHDHLAPVGPPPLDLAAARDHAAQHRDELRLLDRARDAQAARADLATWE